MTPGEKKSRATHPPAQVLSPTAASSFLQAETLLVLLLAVFSLVTAWSAANRTTAGVDFYQFWCVGQVVGRADVTNIYSEPERARLGVEFFAKAQQDGDPRRIQVAQYRQTFETYSSPFLYTVYRICSAGNFQTDHRNYLLLMLASISLGVVWWSRMLGHSWTFALAVLALLAAWFDPFYADLLVGNVNSFQFLTLVVFVWLVTQMRWTGRDVLAGGLLGLALAFKPNLIYIAGVLVLNACLRAEWRRLGKQAVGAMVGIVVAVLIAAAGFKSFHCWSDWISAVQSMPDAVIGLDHGNFAPSRVLADGLGFNPTVLLILVFGGLTVLGVWLRRGATGNTPGAEVFSVSLLLALGCLLMLLTARLAWRHYFVLAIPAFLVLLAPLSLHRPAVRPAWLQPVGVVLLFLCFATELIAGTGISLSPSAQGTLSLLGIVALFLLAVFSRGGLQKVPSN